MAEASDEKMITAPQAIAAGLKKASGRSFTCASAACFSASAVKGDGPFQSPARPLFLDAPFLDEPAAHEQLDVLRACDRVAENQSKLGDHRPPVWAAFCPPTSPPPASKKAAVPDLSDPEANLFYPLTGSPQKGGGDGFPLLVPCPCSTSAVSAPNASMGRSRKNDGKDEKNKVAYL